MDELIERYLHYLQYERNASPHTLRNYRSDLLQFRDFLATGQRSKSVPIASIDTLRIRAFLADLYAREKKKSSIARKLAAVRRLSKANPTRSLPRLGPLPAVFPHSPVVEFHLGVLRVYIGQNTKAAEQLRAAVADGRGTPYAAEARPLPASLAHSSSK